MRPCGGNDRRPSASHYNSSSFWFPSHRAAPQEIQTRRSNSRKVWSGVAHREEDHLPLPSFQKHNDRERQHTDSTSNLIKSQSCKATDFLRGHNYKTRQQDTIKRKQEQSSNDAVKTLILHLVISSVKTNPSEWQTDVGVRDPPSARSRPRAALPLRRPVHQSDRWIPHFPRTSESRRLVTRMEESATRVGLLKVETHARECERALTHAHIHTLSLPGLRAPCPPWVCGLKKKKESSTRFSSPSQSLGNVWNVCQVAKVCLWKVSLCISNTHNSSRRVHAPGRWQICKGLISLFVNEYNLPTK